MTKKTNTQKPKTSSRTIYYVHDTGSGLVTENLRAAAGEEFEEVHAHPQMSCFNRRGHLVQLFLWEVPWEILSRLRKRRGRHKLDFTEFIQKGDGKPTEVASDKTPRVKTKKRPKKKRQSVGISIS